jgi:hypothetical protein
MKVFFINTLLLAMAIGLVGGCKVGEFAEIGPQSHFNYPNSNVKAIAPVKVSMNGPSGFLPTFGTGELDEKMYNTAIAQVEGANLLIDYVKTTKIYMVPVIGISWTTNELEGTAAKMELGQQTLK